MAINQKMSADERKQLSSLIKQRPNNKLVNPQEKIGEKIPKDFNPRSH